MPRLSEPRGEEFLDAWGRPVRTPDGEAIRPGLVTGYAEMWLMTAASFRLTEQGRVVAGELRAHLAATRRPHQFALGPGGPATLIASDA